MYEKLLAVMIEYNQDFFVHHLESDDSETFQIFLMKKKKEKKIYDGNITYNQVEITQIANKIMKYF